MVLAGFYQQAHELDSANPEVRSGVADAYTSLGGFAGDWNTQRFATIGKLIKQAHEALPGTGEQDSQLQSVLASTAGSVSVDRVKALIRADSIMQPAGASVFDAARKLGTAEFQQAKASEEWQQMMSRFRESAVTSLKASDFDSASRVVEAALSIDPEDVQMRSIERHLQLQ